MDFKARKQWIASNGGIQDYVFYFVLAVSGCQIREERMQEKEFQTQNFCGPTVIENNEKTWRICKGGVTKASRINRDQMKARKKSQKG